MSQVRGWTVTVPADIIHDVMVKNIKADWKGATMTKRRLSKKQQTIKKGDIVQWYEDFSSVESGPQAPDECRGPVLAVERDRIVVESHYSGEPIKLLRKNVDLVQKRKRLSLERRKRRCWYCGRARTLGAACACGAPV